MIPLSVHGFPVHTFDCWIERALLMWRQCNTSEQCHTLCHLSCNVIFRTVMVSFCLSQNWYRKYCPLNQYFFHEIVSSPKKLGSTFIFQFLPVRVRCIIPTVPRQVESDSSYERIGGTSLGGGTFWGLGTLLTGARGFDQLLDLASSGDHRNVDLLVKDIYGGLGCILLYTKTFPWEC